MQDHQRRSVRRAQSLRLTLPGFVLRTKVLRGSGHKFKGKFWNDAAIASPGLTSCLSTIRLRSICDLRPA